MAPIARRDKRGVVQVFNTARYMLANPRAQVLRCLHCARAWDDSVPTAWTPAPSARCPFEHLHK